jgi:hypothetical protein
MIMLARNRTIALILKPQSGLDRWQCPRLRACDRRLPPAVHVADPPWLVMVLSALGGALIASIWPA